jgi:hypothetical protein
MTTDFIVLLPEPFGPANIRSRGKLFILISFLPQLPQSHVRRFKDTPVPALSSVPCRYLFAQSSIV